MRRKLNRLAELLMVEVKLKDVMDEEVCLQERQKLAAMVAVLLTVEMIRNITNGSEAREATSCSTPMMMPLSMRTAVNGVSEENNNHEVELTEWIEVKRDVDALVDALICISFDVNCHSLNGQRVKPNANPASVVGPQRVFQRANPAQMNPAELNPVR